VWPDLDGNWCIVTLKRGTEDQVKKFLAAGTTNFENFTAQIYCPDADRAAKIHHKVIVTDLLFETTVQEATAEQMKRRAGGKGYKDGKLKGRGKGRGGSG